MLLKNSRPWRILRICVCVCLCLLLLFLAFPAHAEPETESGGEETAKTEANNLGDAVATGWVEVKASVPEGFEHSLILTIVNTETYAEIDFRILPDNDYIDRRQIPYGTYSVKQAFAPNDIRYAGIPAEDTFTLTGEEKAAVLISLTVDMMEQYKKDDEEVVTEISVDTEPEMDERTDEVIQEMPDVEEEEPDNKVPEDDSLDEKGDPDNKSQERSDTKNTEPDSGRSFLERVILALFGTAIFVSIVIVVAYLVRRHFRH